MISEAKYIWRDGEVIPWQDASVHILSLAVQFGSSVFEGVRCYSTPDGPAIFRWPEHLRRLYDSCRIYRMELPWTPEQLTVATAQLIERNGLDSCYVRPMVLRGYGDAGMLPVESPVQTFVACWPWGTYLGEGALERGVDVCVSSWNRAAPNTYPSMAKSAGHYNNAQLIKMEAAANGYVEAIALGPGGMVSEGSGQNVMLVRDGVLVTTPVDGTILQGITRDSVLRIAADLGIEVRETAIPREMLYTADEVFFTGTAAEITPIRSIDRVTIGVGARGPVTEQIQQRFLDIVNGRADDSHGWLTHVRKVLDGAAGSGSDAGTADAPRPSAS
ncbi:MAG TPA: branched-chain amino acid transaminase [Longimicrobiales bacterium]|nr:branched-chain amino acid transaminase [Longimicrobiales bacterium]